MAEQNFKPMPDWVHYFVYLFREIGIAGVLIGLVCYQFFYQIPAVQQDFRTQTNKLVEAVSNNSQVSVKIIEQLNGNTRVLEELAAQIKRQGK